MLSSEVECRIDYKILSEKELIILLAFFIIAPYFENKSWQVHTMSERVILLKLKNVFR